MKVFHLMYSEMGGVASVVFSLIEADKDKILNQKILFAGPSLYKSYKLKAKKLKIKYNWVKTIKFLPLFSYFIVIKKILIHKPEVIFLHNFFIIPCVIYKLFFKKIIIIYINHTPINNITWKDAFVKKFNFFIDRFILLNKKSYLFYKKRFNIPLKKISLITNGINIKFFSKSYLRKKKYFKIGMACRVNKLKKYDLILESLLTKELKNLDIIFSLAGVGEDLNNFKNKINELKINNKIKTEGYLDEINLKKWYNSLDLYIHASSGEGMSTSILQAMSMKLPVLGSHVTGITDVIGRKKYLGLLFKNNVNDLSKKIKYFYFLNKKTKIKFIKTQYDYILVNHDYRKMFEKYLSLITK